LSHNGIFEVLDQSDRNLSDDAFELHQRCGIYTKKPMAESLLASIGWCEAEDLTNARLLEPCSGNGALLEPAIKALIGSFRIRGIRLSYRGLADRIAAFEIHPKTANQLQIRICELLISMRLSRQTSEKLASHWFSGSDYLLANVEENSFSHIVANPPYVRWANVPKNLAKTYSKRLPKEVTRGDLCISFIAKMIDTCAPNGQIGLLSSDRWLYSGYAETFRQKWLPHIEIKEFKEVMPSEAFVNKVSAYPVAFVLRKKLVSNGAAAKQLYKLGRSKGTRESRAAAKLLSGWNRKFAPIEQNGCRVRVGPALGHEPAFVAKKNDFSVEDKLLIPFVRPREIVNDEIDWNGFWALCVNTPDKGLIDLSEYPLAQRRLKTYKTNLIGRSCVNKSESWFKTIDKTEKSMWAGEKLLIPELSKFPRVAHDELGFMPSHGIYAIFSEQWPLKILRALLACGVLGAVLSATAPKLNGGFYRCYKRFLTQIPIPEWSGLEIEVREALILKSEKSDKREFTELVANIYETDLDLFNTYATTSWRQD